MRIKTLAALAFAFLTHAASQASVIYQWKSLNGGAPDGISLRLEFTDAAFKAGSMSFHVSPDQSGQTHPESGLLSLYFAHPDGSPMTYQPREEAFRFGLGYLDMDVTFEPGGFLSGDISANNQEHDFAMSAQGRVFTILGAGSDDIDAAASAACSWSQPDGCRGATGELRTVPEPASLALFAIGAMGALGALRRRTANRRPVILS